VVASLLVALLAAGSPLGDAVAAYDRFDYPRARGGFEPLSRTGTDHEKAVSFLYLGLIEAASGDEAAARRRFRQALQLEAVNAPAGTSPRFLELIEDARREVGPPKPDLSARPPLVIVERARSPVARAAIYGGGGLAIAGFVAGGVLGVLSRRDIDAYRSRDDLYVKLRPLAESSRSEAVAADVAFAAGAAGAALALTTWLATR
jgi:hypothetical protein